MKVLEQYADGSRTVLFEVGDRVRLTRDYFIGNWKTDSKGDVGTVIASDVRDTEHPSIAFVEFHSDRAKADHWGSIRVPPWYLEPEEETR